MSVAAKIIALFAAMKDQDLEPLPPATRRRFADICRHWAERAEPKDSPPRSGVLASLKSGDRAQ
jgi:hypothetical protein